MNEPPSQNTEQRQKVLTTDRDTENTEKSQKAENETGWDGIGIHRADPVILSKLSFSVFDFSLCFRLCGSFLFSVFALYSSASIITTRKPMRLVPRSGGLAARAELRHSDQSDCQLPPRITFAAPVAGPGGSSVGLLL